MRNISLEEYLETKQLKAGLTGVIRRGELMGERVLLILNFNYKWVRLSCGEIVKDIAPADIELDEYFL